MKPDIVVKKGEIILCPNCKSEIAKVVEDIYQYMQLLEPMFEGISQSLNEGDETNCEKCGCAYFISGQLYTKDGWRPSREEILKRGAHKTQ